jgi:hypothetical protein
VLHLRLIILSVGGDVPVNSDALLVTDFVNLMIKSAQSFGCVHKDRVCVYVYRSKCSYVYEDVTCLYFVSKKMIINLFFMLSRMCRHSRNKLSSRPLPACFHPVLSVFEFPTFLVSFFPGSPIFVSIWCKKYGNGYAKDLLG